MTAVTPFTSDLLSRLRAAGSVARFKPDPVPESTLNWILETGCQTATPWNLRPWRFVVVQSPAGRSRLLRQCFDPGPAATAPVLLLALADPAAWKRAPVRLAELVRMGSVAPEEEARHLERIRAQWGVGDAASVLAIAQTHAALQQICVSAFARDICAWWVREFDARGLARSFSAPRDLLVVAVLALGYCAEKAPWPAAPLHRTVFSEAYGLPWESNSSRTG